MTTRQGSATTIRWGSDSERGEAVMRDRFLRSISVTALTAVAVGIFWVSVEPTSAQAPASAAMQTPWGEPDLQGIWTDETDTPLQRPAQYANQEFFTEEQRVEID